MLEGGSFNTHTARRAVNLERVSVAHPDEVFAGLVEQAYARANGAYAGAGAGDGGGGGGGGGGSSSSSSSSSGDGGCGSGGAVHCNVLSPEEVGEVLCAYWENRVGRAACIAAEQRFIQETRLRATCAARCYRAKAELEAMKVWAAARDAALPGAMPLLLPPPPCEGTPTRLSTHEVAGMIMASAGASATSSSHDDDSQESDGGVAMYDSLFANASSIGAVAVSPTRAGGAAALAMVTTDAATQLAPNVQASSPVFGAAEQEQFGDAKHTEREREDNGGQRVGALLADVLCSDSAWSLRRFLPHLVATQAAEPLTTAIAAHVCAAAAEALSDGAMALFVQIGISERCCGQSAYPALLRMA